MVDAWHCKRRGTGDVATPAWMARLSKVPTGGHLILIVSYEVNHRHGGTLRGRNGGVDVLVVDEAHRLRNLGKMAEAVADSSAGCRVLLTATPLANDLLEFYTVANIVKEVRGRRPVVPRTRARSLARSRTCHCALRVSL